MSKFKPGDRVAVYGYTSDNIMNHRAYYTIVEANGSDLSGHFDGDECWPRKLIKFHAKQCRKLVKTLKVKKVRR